MANELFRIVLGKSAAGHQASVAAEFAALFGVNENLSAQIVRSAPIVVLTDLSRNQAMEVMQVMVGLRKAGCDLRIEISDDRSISQVAWPTPPLIAGKAIDEYECDSSGGGKSIFCCPECGARLEIMIAAARKAAAAPFVAPAAASAVAPTSEQPSAPAPDAVLDKASAPAQRPTKVAVVADALFDEPLFEGIKPLTDTSGYDAVLGDLKKFDAGIKDETEKAALGGGNKVVSKQESVGESGPPGSSTVVSKPRSKLKSAPSEPQYEEGPFSVVIPHTANPRVVPLVMRHMGLSEDQAREALKKPMIPVVKNLSRGAANEVADEYRKLGVNPRIGRRK